MVSLNVLRTIARPLDEHRSLAETCITYAFAGAIIRVLPGVISNVAAAV